MLEFSSEPEDVVGGCCDLQECLLLFQKICMGSETPNLGGWLLLIRNDYVQVELSVHSLVTQKTTEMKSSASS